MKILALTTALLLPASLAAQETEPLTVLESYQRARSILDAAVAAHGGPEALAAARQLHLQLAGVDHWRNQSRRVAPPYDTASALIDLKIDLGRGRIAWDATQTYPGGARRAWRNVTDSTRSYRLDHRSQTYTTHQWPPADQQLGNLFYAPQFIVQAARQNPAVLRWVGRMRLSSGSLADVISTSVANGQLNLAFDPETKLLRATVGVWSDPLTGDMTQETEFADYRLVDGILLPARRISWVAGEKTRELSYVKAARNFVMPDSAVTVPAGYTLAASTQAENVRTLAPGVWTIGNPAVLAVEFADHVVVVDAPPFGATDAINRLRELANGKPVRYVVPTHHHDDHSGGIKHFAANGATIVTTAANRAFMSRLARARTTLQADAAALTGEPRIEVFTGARTFTDGTRTLEVHNIGPSPHAEEVLIAWLPRERILFQGDLIEVSPDGGIARGANNETTMHFADWLKRKGWNVATYAGAHGALREPQLFEDLARQPILR